MQEGHLYYLSDQYFIDFPDRYLMRNKEIINRQSHNRPCFYAFKDTNTGLYWMIPFSSQVDKFRDIYNKKVKKYRYCNTIKFGYVLGREKAFLIQNMCPVTDKYILNKYIDGVSRVPVQINNVFAKKLVADAKRVLLLQRQGKKLIFPDVLKIEAMLLG